MSFIWRNTRLYRLFLHVHNQNSIRMNWSGWKRRKNVILQKNAYPLPLVGIELGSCEFKSKSSNHWAVEANDENWQKFAQSILLHITILFKETDWWKVRWSTWTIDFNRKSICSPVSAPLMHVMYWWLPFDMNFFRYVGQVLFFKVVGAHDVPIINIWQPMNVIYLTKYSFISTFSACTQSE